METTNWGIIGPGNIAHDFARDLELIGTPQKITAVLGHRPETIAKFITEFNVSLSYTDINDFIKNTNIDIVYIATPHPQHFEQAVLCLENKIPVLCEKPMTINAEQSRQLIAAAQKNNTFLMEGRWLRFLPSIQLVLSFIKERIIGNTISLKASMGYKAPYDPENRYFDPALGGGALLDLGIYPVFLARLLLGNPDTIKAIGTLSNKGVDETCSILFHYKSGQHAVLESSLVTETDLPAEISGDKGSIKILNPWFEKAAGIELDLPNAGKVIYPCKWDGHGLHYEIREALDCIQNKKIESDMLSHAFSLDMIRIMDEIRNQIHVAYQMYE